MSFTYTQRVGETVKQWVSVRGIIDPTDTVTGTPTAVGDEGELTIANVQANTEDEKIGGLTSTPGQAIGAEISGGVAGQTYDVYFEFDTVEGSHRFTKTPITITVVADPT